MTFFKHIATSLLLLTTCVCSCNNDDAYNSDDQEKHAVTIWSSGDDNSMKMRFEWNATSDNSWITLPKRSGNKDEVMVIRILPNTTGYKRTGYVTVENKENNTKTRLYFSQWPVMSGEANGHKYIDIGTKVFWATENISYTSSGDNVSKYKASEIAAAVASWGEKWRLPTQEEFQELQTWCQETNKYIEYTAPNGERVTFPFTIDASESNGGWNDVNPGGGYNGGFGEGPTPITPYWVSSHGNYSLFDLRGSKDLSKEIDKSWYIRLVMDR